MSEITQTAGTAGNVKLKIVRERKPKAKPGPGSFRYGTHSAATATPATIYGPCSLHVDIDSRSVIGDASEAGPIRAFCDGFAAFPELCSVKSYGVSKGTWTVSLDLASDEKAVDDPFISEMSRQFTAFFDASPVLKREFGAGKARYRVLNGGTTVDDGPLN